MKRKIEGQSDLPQAMLEVFGLPELMFSAIPFAANNHMISCNAGTIKNDLSSKRADIKQEINAERLRCSY